MCNCSCGSEEKKNALLPQVGIITDIRRETPDVKHSVSFVRTAPSCLNICLASVQWSAHQV